VVWLAVLGTLVVVSGVAGLTLAVTVYGERSEGLDVVDATLATEQPELPDVAQMPRAAERLGA
jgi:predicted porin